MIDKIKENKIKFAVVICGTVIAVTAMITGAEVPAWVLKVGSLLLGFD